MVYILCTTSCFLFSSEFIPCYFYHMDISLNSFLEQGGGGCLSPRPSRRPFLCRTTLLPGVHQRQEGEVN